MRASASGFRAILGWSWAGLTLAGAALAPFLLDPLTRGLAALPVAVADPFTGGAVARILPREGYRIRIHRPVLEEAPLQEAEPFVQVDWEPVAGLPSVVEERLDLVAEGLGTVAVRFAVPADPAEPPTALLAWADGSVTTLRGEESRRLSRLFLRTRERMILRLPLRPARG